MDFDRDGEICFDEFYNVMTGRIDLEAQAVDSISRSQSGRMIKTDGSGTQHLVAGSSRSIRDIKALFDDIDEDSSGYLDRDEVRNVSRGYIHQNLSDGGVLLCLLWVLVSILRLLMYPCRCGISAREKDG